MREAARQALDHFRAGRLDAAARAARATLLLDPDSAEMNRLLGVILFEQGNCAAAREPLARAAGSAGATAEMHNNYGVVLNALGEHAMAIAAFERALEIDPRYTHALNNLGILYRNTGRGEAALQILRRAATLDPGLADAQTNLRLAYSDIVPSWHFAMMGDERRNALFETAIRGAVAGKHVLDIGTGAGLLAMMAARAGAASVVTCEKVPLVAERADAVIARNGYGDRIRVVAKPSSDLAVGYDLPQRADVLITETFSSNLLDEGVLPTVEDAHERLLVPRAVVVPASASVMGYLAGGELLTSMLFARRASGFDVSPFDVFAPIIVATNRVPHDALSDDTEILHFDFSNRHFPVERRRLAITVTKDGECAGVMTWIRLQLNRETRYENRPSPDARENGHWDHVVHRFPEPVSLKRGDRAELIVAHDRNQVAMTLVGLRHAG